MPYVQSTPYETEIIRGRMEEFLPALVHIPEAVIHRITITSDPSGSCLVHNYTNDDDDDGVADGRWESWTVEYPSVEMALAAVGKCRVGISGVIVTVTVDGKEIR